MAMSKNAKIAIIVSVVSLFVLLCISVVLIAIGVSQGGLETKNPGKTKVERKAEKKQKPEKKEESEKEKLVKKVKAIIDKMDEDERTFLAETSVGGYQGDILGVEQTSYDDAVKVRVSTYFSDPGDSEDGGKNIAFKIFSMVCMDIPELDSLYVVSDGSGLESRSIYRNDIPACKSVS